MPQHQSLPSNLKYPSLHHQRLSHATSRRRLTIPSSLQIPNSNNSSSNTLPYSQHYSASMLPPSSLTKTTSHVGAAEEASEVEAAEDGEGEEEVDMTMHRISGRRSRATMMP
jgi:hypothetical protein